MNIRAIKTRTFTAGENLFDFLIQYLPKKLPEKSVVVITSKIISYAEKRLVTIPENLSKEEHMQFREDLIYRESDWMVRTPYTWLTIKDGVLMASAGIDESNASGTILLLPKDSFKTAQKIRKQLRDYYSVTDLGVLVTDSRLLPLRSGVVGVTLGYAGFKGIRDYRGTKDLFGRVIKLSRTDIADSLATAAVMEMGEGNESQPLALITKARIDFTDRVSRKELYIDPRKDMYGPFFSAQL